jgi:hypothetical protein
MNTLSRIWLGVIAGCTGAALATPAAAATCESLSSLSLPHTTVTVAQSITTGSFTPPGSTTALTGLPQFCRVALNSRPSSDSNINIEVWIPAVSAAGGNWNGKYEQLGNGGFAGAISYGGLAAALTRGYAVAATDDGTSGPPRGAASLVGHPERAIDFGWRALKETTDNAKRVINALTGLQPTKSYFSGCSDGGREALQEAQRFPQDFDGIIAGSPANDWVGLFTGHDWNMQALLNGPQTNGVPDAYVPASKLSILSKAALAQCACQDDGVPSDRFLNDPRDCRFDPASVQCKAGQDPATCLTAAQVAAVKKIYRGPHDSAGRRLFPGYEPGVESHPSNWPAWIVGASASSPGLHMTFSIGFWADEVFENPAFNVLTVNFDRDYPIALAKVAPVVSSTNPDLRPFERRGGKLIQYAGWADAAIAPMNGLNYYESVRDVLRGKRHRGHDDDSLEELRDFYRVFMVPGMAHCAGGEGPNAFGNGVNGPVVDARHDLLRALEAWVEHGVAPRKIIGTHYLNNAPASGVEFQRPLCPYPEVARWQGGDPAVASSFACVVDDRDADDPRNQ